MIYTWVTSTGDDAWVPVLATLLKRLGTLLILVLQPSGGSW